MSSKEIIISPLNSVKKSTKIILILSIWLFIITLVGLVTGGINFILLPVCTLSVISIIFNIIKTKKNKNNIFLIKNNKLYTKKETLDLKTATYKIDKHNNIIFYSNNNKIKVNRLSYNFEWLLDYLKNNNTN